MKSKTWFSLSIGALILAAALPATQALAQTKGGTLNMIVQPEPPVIVTAINQQGPTQFVAGKIYESLLTYTTDLKPQPGLAKSWEASSDGLTYTFHLQDNVKWHDGKPFTADDVVFTLSDMLPKTHARARVILNKFVDSVQATDPKTVVIKLKSPFPAFMLMFEPGFAPMMPKHIYAGTDYMTNPANQKPIGTGPFVFKEWKRGEYIKLARNPDYWKPGKPYLDELVFNVIPDAASRAVAFERGSVDVLRGGDVDNVDIKRLRALPKVEYTTAGWEMFSPQAYLIFNMRKPPFDNLKVRQAVMAAINRNMVVNNIFFGLGKVSTSPFVTTEMFYDKNMPPMPFDMKKARADQGIGHQARRLHHPPVELPVRLDLGPPGRVHQAGAGTAGLQGQPGIDRRRRLGQPHRQLGLRPDHQLHLPVRRPGAGRAAPVHLVEHRQGIAVRQRAGLQQSRDRQAMGSRRVRGRPGQAPGALHAAADHPGQ